jgi:WD40 repeat protein
LQGLKQAVQAVVFAPDGRTLLSAGSDRLVRVWELATGKEVARWQGHPNAVLSLALSPDGQTLASGGYDQSVKVWDVSGGKTEQLVVTLQGGLPAVMTLAFSPDGKSLAGAFGDRLTFGTGGGVVEWGTADWKPRAGLTSEGSGGQARYFTGVRRAAPPEVLAETPYGGVQGLAYTPDGQALVLGTARGGVVLWDRAQKRPRAAFAQEGCRAIALSPDGRTVAAAEARAILLWDVASGTRRATLRGHTSLVWSLAFSPDGKLLLSGAKDGTVRFWDAISGEARGAFDWQIGTIHQVAFAPDGMTAAVAGHTGTVVVWDVDPDDLRGGTATQGNIDTAGLDLAPPARTGPVRLEHKKPVQALAFAPDGRTLATLAFQDCVRLWDTASGRERARVPKKKTDKETGYCLAISPDGRTLAVSLRYSIGFRLWDLETGEPRSSCLPMNVAAAGQGYLIARAPRGLAYFPDGDRLLVGEGSWDRGFRAGDLEVRVVEVMGLQAILLLGRGGMADLALRPDGRVAALATAERGVVLWEVTGQREREHSPAMQVKCLALEFAPEGRTLAGAVGRMVYLWDADSGALRTLLKGHKDEVRSLAFTPDGRTLLSGGKDRTVRLWDVAAGTESAVLEWDVGLVNAVAVSPDGRCAAAGGHTGVVVLWDLEVPAAS